MRALLRRLAFGGPRRRRLARLARERLREVPVPQLTVRSPRLLRLMGFTVGDARDTTYLARAGCRIDIMRMPAPARPIGTGRPVRQVRMSVLSWAQVACWRLAGKL
jgi:hypothetical protein